jgi:hypothetical protein
MDLAEIDEHALVDAQVLDSLGVTRTELMTLTVAELWELADARGFDLVFDFPESDRERGRMVLRGGATPSDTER